MLKLKLFAPGGTVASFFKPCCRLSHGRRPRGRGERSRREELVHDVRVRRIIDGHEAAGERRRQVLVREASEGIAADLAGRLRIAQRGESGARHGLGWTRRRSLRERDRRAVDVGDGGTGCTGIAGAPSTGRGAGRSRSTARSWSTRQRGCSVEREAKYREPRSWRAPPPPSPTCAPAASPSSATRPDSPCQGNARLR